MIRWKSLLTMLWVPIVLVVFWETASRLSPNIFFPPPSEIVQSAENLDLVGFWLFTLAPTLSLLAQGFVTGALLGLVFGTWLGAYQALRTVIYPTAVFLRSIPTAAKLPVILGIVGIGTEALQLAVTLAVFLNVVVVTIIGVSRVDEKTLETAKVLQLSWLRTTFGIRLPAAMGDILTGVQSALQVAILVTVLVETLASGLGIGSFLQQASSLFRFTQMWLGLLVLGLVGVIGNEVFHFLERKIVPWYFATRVAQ